MYNVCIGYNKQQMVNNKHRVKLIIVSTLRKKKKAHNQYTSYDDGCNLRKV